MSRKNFENPKKSILQCLYSCAEAIENNLTFLCLLKSWRQRFHNLNVDLLLFLIIKKMWKFNRLLTRFSRGNACLVAQNIKFNKGFKPLYIFLQHHLWTILTLLMIWHYRQRVKLPINTCYSRDYLYMRLLCFLPQFRVLQIDLFERPCPITVYSLQTLLLKATINNFFIYISVLTTFYFHTTPK